MENFIKNKELRELSKNEKMNTQGGSPLTKLIFEGLGWLAGNFNYYYEAGAAGAEYGPKF